MTKGWDLEPIIPPLLSRISPVSWVRSIIDGSSVVGFCDREAAADCNNSSFVKSITRTEEEDDDDDDELVEVDGNSMHNFCFVLFSESRHPRVFFQYHRNSLVIL